ncbi:hypothetical protein B0H15DRAFT_852033 [Mycena belliarum]|uniref:Uncharacterized protein n=1 Tax=Mycena belliarum TaxID=1033014 RepID=A0AAD6U2W1_9AGAR|nr:hypothetical protein B0H15DRAFT_852033 [Mycena belliae]
MVQFCPSPPRLPLALSRPPSLHFTSLLKRDSLPPTDNSQPEKIPSTNDEQRKMEGLRTRLTCSTPAFNQSTKFSYLAPALELPASPMMQRGQGICNLWRYTDYKSTLAIEPCFKAPRSPPSSALGRKSSRLRLRLRRSKTSSSSDGSSDGRSSRSSSPGAPILTEKALPSLPPLFSPCTSPIDEYYQDVDTPSAIGISRPQHSIYKIPRKPAPEYIPPAIPRIVLHTSVPPMSSASSVGEHAESENPSSLQIVGPNSFIAYDDDNTLSALTSAFTHIIRVSPADNVGAGILRAPRSEISFEPEAGVHTLLLPIPPPAAQPSAFPLASAIASDISPRKESHHGADFASPLLRQKFRIRRKPVPQSAPPLARLDPFPTGDLNQESHQLVEPAFSQADLVATQQFLASSGRLVSLQELAYYLSDSPAPLDAPLLGLEATQIETALAFLRPHPFAPNVRRRVLVVVPRGQLALEGLALMACYLAGEERCSVRFALRKLERSVGTVFRPWRGLLGGDGAFAAYLEELLQAAQGGK